MRRVVLFMGVSLDGFIEGPNREIGWHRVDDELHRYMNEKLRTMGAFLHGRVVYELMASVWPTAAADPAAPPAMAEFSRIWMEMPKIVFSRTLARVEHNSTLRREVDPDEINALKAQPGGDLSLGGADLAASFMRHDLIDAYHVCVHPALVGRGKRLFPEADVIRSLRHVETRTFGNGVVLLRYER